jgi:predicted nucleotide-binding protein (sugar kinase/HSP70/actin superfamily)
MVYFFFLLSKYPMWFTVFTKLGFRVLLSRESSDKLLFSAMDTIQSEV